jgi:tripartite-type tricarboxylate transporter receptor subunit TctC
VIARSEGNQFEGNQSMTLHLRLTALVLSAVLAMITAASAEDAAQFYHNKTINMVVGFNPGGGADAYARLVARHLGRHIAGNPNVVVRNMQGAGSVIAANYVFNISPKDGTEIGLFAGNIVIDPLIGGTQHKYEAHAFNWIGAPASESLVCLSSPKTSFKTLDDVLQREIITGTSGTATLDMPVAMNNALGAKFKMVKGYGGSAAMRLAMERGEIEAFCGVGLTFLRTTGLIAPERANILVQVALTKNPALPKVPFILDYAKTDEIRQIFTLLFGWLDFERPIAAPPGVPAERVRALREGFDKAMNDPALLADAQKSQVSVAPMSGAAIAKFVDEVSRTPAAVTARAAQILGRVK